MNECYMRGQKTAYEEASHAIIHHHFRREIEEVVATDGGSSYCQLARESGFNVAELMERDRFPDQSWRHWLRNA